MCEGCWQGYGSPRIRNEYVDALVPMLRAADPYGPLHIVIDDWNLAKSHIRWCLTSTSTRDRLTDHDRAVGKALLAVSLKERASAMAIADGYV